MVSLEGLGRRLSDPRTCAQQKHRPVVFSRHIRQVSQEVHARDSLGHCDTEPAAGPDHPCSIGKDEAGVPNRPTQLGLAPGLHDHLGVESHYLQRLRPSKDCRLTKIERLLPAAPVHRHPQQFDTTRR
jgi:hypothetical protein